MEQHGRIPKGEKEPALTLPLDNDFMKKTVYIPSLDRTKDECRSMRLAECLSWST